nr:transcription factor IIIA-like [Quercus suber]POF15483.1 transcription factor iiia [Quercus suber]
MVVAKAMKRSAPNGAEGTPTSKRVRYPEESQYQGSLDGSIPESTFTSTSAKRTKDYVCELAGCGKAFDRPVKLEIHRRTHTNERPYACGEDDCDKTFQRKEHLTRHIKDKHSDERPHICSYSVTNAFGESVQCAKSFHTAAKLRRHVAAHEEKEQTKCSEPGCGKIFRRQETLQRHILQNHLGEKAFRCTHFCEELQEQCGQAFETVGHLKGHVKRAHAIPVIRHYCDICNTPGSQVSTAGSSPDHAEISVPTQTSRIGFTSYADLQVHIKMTHPPSCPECGKLCESNRALKAHRDIEHSSLPERQQHKCSWPGCDRGFTKAGNLKVHIQNVHAKQRTFICGTFDLSQSKKVVGWTGNGCGAGFSSKASLEEHVRTQHLGIPSKLAPSRLKKLRDEAASPSQSLSSMDTDELTTPNDDDHSMAMLTGYGYEKARPIACLESHCIQRFRNDYELSQHVELTHDWQVDDIEDALAEREALDGGQFWIGGREDIGPSAIETQSDVQLRIKLQNALLGDDVAGAGNMFDSNWRSPPVWESPPGGTTSAISGSSRIVKDTAGVVEPMAIDPALSGP